MPANHSILDVILDPLDRGRTPSCRKPKRLPGQARDTLKTGEALVAGQRWQSRFSSKNTMEADRVHRVEGNRTPYLIDGDRVTLEAASLSMQKASQLKPYWANGLSAPQTARAFKGQTGYSARTLDDYWAAFNESERRELGKTG